MVNEQVFEASIGFFLRPVQTLLLDDSVTEIMVNGYNEIYFERRGRLYASELSFETEDALLSAVRNVAQYVGRSVDHQNPGLDARLPDGSRVHAVIPPSARRGT